MATNYQRGRSAEYTVMRMLEDEGWFPFRMAGSKSPADIIATSETGGFRLVQVKSGKTSYGPKARAAAFVELNTVGAPAHTKRELWHLRRRGPGKPGEWTVYTEDE